MKRHGHKRRGKHYKKLARQDSYTTIKPRINPKRKEKFKLHKLLRQAANNDGLE